MMRITKQEMFTRAITGLKSQDFERCANEYGEPLYADGKGRHCAFGWIDTEITSDQSTWYIDDLAGDYKGLASRMTMEQLEFARQLQWCHDESTTPASMERRLRRLGEREDLVWPV
jgi:hypothetical protein